MTVRRFHPLLPALLLSLLSGAARASAQGPPSSTRPPNIIWLLAEDMGPDLGVFGTPEVRTPNLDRLARGGMLFTRAFTTAPVCSASRSAFNTGMYQTSIDAQNHRSHRPDDGTVYPFPLPDGVMVVSDWLRHAGYFTGNIVDFPAGIGFKGSGKTDWNFSYEGKPFDTSRWEDLKAHQPFYAQINFQETHRGEDWDSAQTAPGPKADPAKVVFPPYYPDDPVVRKDWAAYLNTVMTLDEKVGRILDLLRREGLADNTVIVFMGDHGRAMVRGKQWPYDSGLHVPLIVHWPSSLPAPDHYRAGGVSDQLISAIDLTATTLAIAGAPKPPRMQGRVFLGAHVDPPRRYLFGGRDRGDETVDRIRTVRTARYRYLRNYFPERPFLQTNRYKEANYPVVWVLRRLHAEGKLTPAQDFLVAPTRPREELYDLETDPYEIHNLAGSPDHQEILRQLRSRLEQWIVESDDKGRIPESPAVYEFYEERSKRMWSDKVEAARQKYGIPSVDSTAAPR
jgi:arylsulfatase A-like enzyme